MYNGIGLQTVRGSGTNGYVQRNLSYVKDSSSRLKLARSHREHSSGDFNARGGDKNRRSPNTDILLHEQKRKVELKLLELALEMEDRGCDPEEIQGHVARERKRLLAQRSVDIDERRENYEDTKISHARKKHKEDENERIKDAFGISSDYMEGESFNLEVQERRRQERKERKEKEWKERDKAQQQSQTERYDKMKPRRKSCRSSSRSRLTSSIRRSKSPSESCSRCHDESTSRKSHLRPHVMVRRSRVPSYVTERKLQSVSSRSHFLHMRKYSRSRSRSHSRGRELRKENRLGKHYRAINEVVRSRSRSLSNSRSDSRSSSCSESDR